MNALARTCPLVLAMTLASAGVADSRGLCPPAAEPDVRSDQERVPGDPEPSHRSCATAPCNTPVVHVAVPAVARPAPWAASPVAAPCSVRGLDSPAPPTPPPRRAG